MYMMSVNEMTRPYICRPLEPIIMSKLLWMAEACTYFMQQ